MSQISKNQDQLIDMVKRLIDNNSEEQKAIRSDIEELQKYKVNQKLTKGDLLYQLKFVNQNIDKLIEIYEILEKRS